MGQLTTGVHESISVLIADADSMSAHLIADEITRGRHDISVIASPIRARKRSTSWKANSRISP